MVFDAFQSSFANLISSWGSNRATAVDDAVSLTPDLSGVFDVAVVGAGPGGSVMVSECGI